MQLRAGTVLAGRYRAEALLGQGGMGQVWRCADLERERPVAVKVVREGKRHEAAARRLRDEVLATAHLRHPGIVGVYDLVQTDDDLALVMELCDGAPLSRAGLDSFAVLRPVWARVLEALAYAHARGVLHLDVKPANVLVEETDNGVHATLVDFGIAQAWRGGPEIAGPSDRVMGTVPYMAPEQLMPSFGAFGPWTDLYAFGATVYRLVAGRPPFDSRDPGERILGAPPRLPAERIGAPDELAELVATLLGPRERDRPTHAADVIAALRALPDGREPSPRWKAEDDGPEADETGVTAATTRTDTGPTERPDVPASGVAPPPASTGGPTDVTGERERPEPGAYALVGMVEPSLRGRNEERSRIWRELVRMRTDREVRVVAITGPLGTGKSRLARDALERAHQHGLAHTAWTAWTEGGAGNEGLRGLLDNIMMTEGASGNALRDRIAHWVERFPGLDDGRFQSEAMLVLDARTVTTTAPDLALRVIVEALARCSEHRATALWLDDLQWSAGAAEALIGRLRERPAPIAVLTTAPEQAPDDADHHIRLEPLRDEATRGLIGGVLDVDDELAVTIARRSEGNPLLTTQLVAELIADGALERRSGRYVLRAGYDASALPGDLPALWDARVARAGADPAMLGALALARPRTSREVIDALAQEVGPALHEAIDRALRSGLLRRSGHFTTWVHASLRQHLCETLSPERRTTFHDAAAQALSVLVGREDVQHERAAHLHGAGRVREACRTMSEAIAWSLRRAEGSAQRRRTETLLQWATEADLPAHRARALAGLAFLEASDGEAERARSLMDQAVGVERDAGLESAWVTWRHAQVTRFEGASQTATELSQRALELARAEGEREVEAVATGQLALDAYRRRDFETARTLFERAAELSRARGDVGSEARALLHLGNMAPTESLDTFDRAVELAERAADSRTELTARQVRADALFLLGDRAKARDEMRDVAARARARGIRPLVSVVEIQLACWALWDGDALGAQEHLEAARTAGARQGTVVERSMSAAIGAAVGAMEGDFDAARRELAELASCRGDYDEPDLRRVLQVGAEHANDKGLAAEFAGALGTPPE